MRLLPTGLVVLAIAVGMTGCDSSSDPISSEPKPSAPREPRVDLASGTVSFGSKCTVSRDDARDTLLYSRDSVTWKLATDSVFPVRDSATYFFRVRRDSLFSGVVRVRYEVPHTAPDLVVGARSYRTVYLGGVRWMAENLDEGTMIKGSDPQSDDKKTEKYCRGDSAANCAIYGGLYQHAEAMGLPSACNGSFCGEFMNIPATVQGICPKGWRLPNSGDWANVAKAAGGWKNLYADTLWAKASQNPDPFGFSVLPGGGRDRSGGFHSQGTDAIFWTSSLFANIGTILYGAGNTSTFWGNASGASVRCIEI